jgi:hypothetical protein
MYALVDASGCPYDVTNCRIFEQILMKASYAHWHCFKHVTVDAQVQQLLSGNAGHSCNMFSGREAGIHALRPWQGSSTVSHTLLQTFMPLICKPTRLLVTEQLSYSV